jgi:hypothetical protein
MRNSGAWAVVFLVVCGCVSSGKWDQLPESAKNLFNRCQRYTVCHGMTDVSYSMCVVDARGRYAENQTMASSRRWVLERGCPPSVANPNLYVHDPEAAGASTPRVASPPSRPTKRRNGDTCDRSADCKSDLCINGYCSEPPKLIDGQPCKESSDCESDMCIRGSCAPASKPVEQSADKATDKPRE